MVGASRVWPKTHRRRDRLRRHRLDADVVGAGPDDDGAGAGALLRRAGAAKNVLNLLMQSFVLIALISVQWVLWGYTLAFGPDIARRSSAGSAHLGLRRCRASSPRRSRRRSRISLFMVYQMMFAIITPALITGAFAERMKFSAFLVFSAAVGDAGLRSAGAHGVGRRADRCHVGARSTSPAARSCTSARASRRWSCALVIGKRLGYGSEPMPPHNLPFTRDRRGAALVRLVRLQRRQRARRERARRHRVRRHQHRGRGGDAVAGCWSEWIGTRQADRARRGQRRGRGSGRDHAGVGLRHADGGARDRRRRRRPLLRRRAT